MHVRGEKKRQTADQLTANDPAGAGGDVRMPSEVKICVDAAAFLPRCLPPLQPRPPQEQHFTTRAQHLEDVQNMSGSAAFGDTRLMSENTGPPHLTRSTRYSAPSGHL